jgi:hypothetical protein
LERPLKGLYEAVERLFKAFEEPFKGGLLKAFRSLSKVFKRP